jgi:predicted TIM-barrel fold metal-dependent hydrolase
MIDMTGDIIEYPIIDTHAHIFNDSMPLDENAWTRPQQPAPVEAYLATLDEHHVSFGVIAANSLYGDYNDYTLAELRKHSRLRGTVIVPPTVDGYTLARMKADGVVGVRLVWFRQGDLPDLNGPDFRKFLTRLADRDLHVQLLLEGERLAAVLEKLGNSGVNVVVDHFGLPNVSAGLNCPGFQAALKSIENGRTWIKLAAYHRMAGMADLYTSALLRRAGTERLLWGSDWPFLAAKTSHTFQDSINEFLLSVPKAADRRKISETALRLYFR